MENGRKRKKEKHLTKKETKKMTPLTCHILRGEDTAEGSAQGLLLHWTDLLCSIEGAIVRTKADHVTKSEADPLTGFHFVIGRIPR